MISKNNKSLIYLRTHLPAIIESYEKSQILEEGEKLVFFYEWRDDFYADFNWEYNVEDYLDSIYQSVKANEKIVLILQIAIKPISRRYEDLKCIETLVVTDTSTRVLEIDNARAVGIDPSSPLAEIIPIKKPIGAYEQTK